MDFSAENTTGVTYAGGRFKIVGTVAAVLRVVRVLEALSVDLEVAIGSLTFTKSNDELSHENYTYAVIWPLRCRMNCGSFTGCQMSQRSARCGK
jgi:hypothetical protein